MTPPAWDFDQLTRVYDSQPHDVYAGHALQREFSPLAIVSSMWRILFSCLNREREVRLLPGLPRLADAVAGFPGPAYAVIDGAQFENLPGMLRFAGFSARALFRSPGDARLERAGPWLVALNVSANIDRLLAITTNRPAAVFWSCFDGEQVLHDHLRRLNTARLPAWAADGESGPGPNGSQGEVTVLFRHWDPRVLGALMPVLDAEQFARVLGPCSEIAYDAPEFGGVKRVIADPSWPPAPNGPLVLGTEQMLALADRRRSVLHRRVSSYLCRTMPELASNVPRQELDAFIVEADVSGRALGIQSEAGHKRWAYLLMATDGQVSRTPGALEFIRNEKRSPDEQVRIMMKLLAARMHGTGDRA